MGLIADSFLSPAPDDDDLRSPVTPGLPAADPSQATVPSAASPAPVSFYAANSPGGWQSGRFTLGQRRLAGDPAPAPAPAVADPAPALPAPAVAAPSTPSDPTRISTAFVDSTPAYSSQAVPAPAIGSKLDDNIDPDTAVSLGLPDASAASGTPSAPPAPAAALKVPSPGLTSAPPAPNDPATGGSGTDDISSLIGGGQDPADAARQQYARDHAADLKHFKAQGGATTITPTGQEVPQYDAQGGLTFKPATLNPVTQLDDGRYYRVDRDATGNQKYFDIEDEGTAGQDYHVDPATGEKYVVTPTAAPGQSKRVVIGQDPYVPAANTIKALAQSHQQDAEQAGLAASQAEQGVAGAPGYGSYPLSSIRGAYQDANAKLAAAQGVVSQAQAVMGERNLTPQEFGVFSQATSTLAQYAPQAQALSSEMDSRQQAITAAQQQRTASMSAFRDAQIVHGQIQAARTDDGSTLSRNLQAVAAGQDIDPAQAKRYVTAGLLTPQPQADGSTSLGLSDTARALLPKPDAPPPDPDPRQTWESQQQALLREFPTLAQPGSTANQTFIRAFQRAGNDPRRALQVARAVLGARN